MGIQVPIVIFADPTGREIADTRLGFSEAPVKATYLEHARKALDSFRGGQKPAVVQKAWAAFGAALRLRGEHGDSGAAVDALRELQSNSPEKGALHQSVTAWLDRLDREEAQGLLEVGKLDLDGDDPGMGLEQLFTVLRDYPGLTGAKKAAALIEEARKDPAKKEALAAAEKEHKAWLALRDAARLARAGKKDEARAAYDRVAKDFPDTAASYEVDERKEALR